MLKEADLHGLDYRFEEDNTGCPTFSAVDDNYHYFVYSDKVNKKERYVYLDILDLNTNIDITLSNDGVLKLWNVLCKWAEEETNKMVKEFEFLGE